MQSKKYIYKLVDQIGINYAKKGLISLSRPISQFKGSEGKFINFAKRIYRRYEKQGLAIEPTETDLKEIREWIEIYFDDGKEINIVDIDSETKILFCGIIQAYCGYFTEIDLFNKIKLKHYLDDNKFKDKIGVVRLELNVFDNNAWNTNDLKESFNHFLGDADNLYGFNGFTHLISVSYTDRFDDYKYLLKKFNENESRYASFLFDNIDINYKGQKEKRIIFLLRSLEKNSSRIGCDNVYKSNLGFETPEIRVFRNMIDVLDYWSKSPTFVYLNVEDKITVKMLNDILE